MERRKTRRRTKIIGGDGTSKVRGRGEWPYSGMRPFYQGIHPKRVNERGPEVATQRKTEATEPGTDLDMVPPKYSDEELLAVQSFDDALALAAQYYGEENLVRADETIGNGFRLLANKDTLIDVPLILLAWRFNPGQYQDQFVSMMVVTKDGRKFVVNDGGSGICQQLATYTNATGRHGGMLVANGFTRSDYEVDLPDPKDPNTLVPTPAHTYYLNTSA